MSETDIEIVRRVFSEEDGFDGRDGTSECWRRGAFDETPHARVGLRLLALGREMGAARPPAPPVVEVPLSTLKARFIWAEEIQATSPEHAFRSLNGDLDSLPVIRALKKAIEGAT